MNPTRRVWLGWLPAWALGGPASADEGVRRGRPIIFPRDHGAHPDTRIEWWYATGWIGQPTAPAAGFQVTFFRSRTGLAPNLPSRFAARHLLFAHAAVTDLGQGRHWHDQRIARWNGQARDGPAWAAVDDADVAIGPWRLQRGRVGWRTRIADGQGRFTLDLTLAPSAAPLLQGDAGFSRKGPDDTQASHYYSEVQLAVGGEVTIGTRRLPATGRAWLDHEWSNELMHPQAVGWDWVGLNLFDGSALTAFRLRRADGSVLWAGGSWRPPGGAARSFAPDEVALMPGRIWHSPATDARYPTDWTLVTPAGRFGVRALLDTQELDSRASTGTLYWEGLSEVLDAGGRRVGLGYLEMTGYAGALRLG